MIALSFLLSCFCALTSRSLLDESNWEMIRQALLNCQVKVFSFFSLIEEIPPVSYSSRKTIQLTVTCSVLLTAAVVVVVVKDGLGAIALETMRYFVPFL